MQDANNQGKDPHAELKASLIDKVYVQRHPRLHVCVCVWIVCM